MNENTTATLTLTKEEKECLIRNLKHGNGWWLMHISEKDKAILNKLLGESK